jgi:hypothetical protein
MKRLAISNWRLAGLRTCRLAYLPAVCCLLFPILLLWRPLFAGEAFYWGTPLLQFVPWQRMAAQMWRSGHLPLWNPLVGCGAPLAANYQTAAFYPLNALYLPLPAEIALTWTTALHLALAGWGMYRWGRAARLDRFPALIGALALEGSGFLVARAALFPSMAFTFPWLAVWLWRGEVLVQRRQLGDALWLGLALGLGLLAGHAQVAFCGGLLLAAYLVFRVRAALGDWRLAASDWQIASLFIVSLLVGVGLAAIQLLPTVELMMQSQRSTGVGYDFAMTYSLWPWRLITFLVPDFFGDPGRGDYWGYATYWEDAGYVGLLPLLLAAGAVLALRKKGNGAGRWRGVMLFWVGVIVCSLLLALGNNTPIFPFLFRHVPTFDLFQAPARWLAITTVALAALAALGAQSWPSSHAGRRRGTLAVVIGAALLVGGLLAPCLVPAIPSTFGPATAWLGGGLVGVGLLTLLRRDASWWQAAAIAFVALDLLFFGRPLVPAVDRALYHGSTDASAALARDSGAARVYWPSDPSQRNRELAEYRVKFRHLAFDSFGPRDVGYWWALREVQLPNAGMLDGVASANNFDPLLVGRYADLLSAAIESPDLLRVMGVTHVASDQPWPGAELVYANDVAALYRLPDAPGRAWIVPNATNVIFSKVPTVLSDPEFDPTFEVLLEQKSLSELHSPMSPFAGSRILSLQDGPNRVTIRAALDAPGYLVLADTWYPGWRVAVDGESAELLRANYAFRAVRLEAGAHTVEMVYRPASVLVGGALSLAALAVIAVGLVWARRQGARE